MMEKDEFLITNMIDEVIESDSTGDSNQDDSSSSNIEENIRLKAIGSSSCEIENEAELIIKENGSKVIQSLNQTLSSPENSQPVMGDELKDTMQICSEKCDLVCSEPNHNSSVSLGDQNETFKTSMSIFDIDDDQETAFGDNSSKVGSSSGVNAAIDFEDITTKELNEEHFLSSPSIHGDSSEDCISDNTPEQQLDNEMTTNESEITNNGNSGVSCAQEELAARELITDLQNKICPILDEIKHEQSKNSVDSFTVLSNKSRSKPLPLNPKLKNAAMKISKSHLQDKPINNPEDNQADDELLLPDKPIVPASEDFFCDSASLELQNRKLSEPIQQPNFIFGMTDKSENGHTKVVDSDIEAFKTVQFPAQHDKAENKESFMQCNMCPPGVIFEYSKMQAHINEIHMEKVIVVAEKHVCLPCFKVCGNMCENSIHYHCPICQQSVASRDLIIDHVQSHEKKTLASEEVMPMEVHSPKIDEFETKFVPLYLGEYCLSEYWKKIAESCISGNNCLLCEGTGSLDLDDLTEHFEKYHLGPYLFILGIGALLPVKAGDCIEFICPFCLKTYNDENIVTHISNCGPCSRAKLVDPNYTLGSSPDFAHFVSIDSCKYAILNRESKYKLPANILNPSVYSEYSERQFEYLKALKAGIKKHKGIRVAKILTSLFPVHNCCKLCPDGKDLFYDKNSKEDHLYSKHLYACIIVKDKWCCLPCHRSCVSSNFETHYHCPVCHMQMVTKDSFSKHMQVEHDIGISVPLFPALESGLEADENKIEESDSSSIGTDSDGYSIKNCFVKLDKLCKEDILAAGISEYDNSRYSLSDDEYSNLEERNDRFVEEEIPYKEMVDSDDSDLSCRFCTYKTYKDKMDCIEAHILTEHWETRVNVFNKYWTIPCFKRCGSMHSVHYHCPICKTTVYGTGEIFIKHVNRHPNTEILHKPGPKVSKILPLGNFTIPNRLRQKFLAEASSISSSNTLCTSSKNVTFPPSQPSESNIDAIKSNVKDMEGNFQPLNNKHSVLEIVDSLDENGYLEFCYYHSEGNLRCRLCPYLCEPNEITAMMGHLKSHHLSEVAIVDQKWLCLPFYCHDNLDAIMDYYHCPFCNIAILKKNGFLLHVIAHGATVSFDMSSLVTKGLQDQTLNQNSPSPDINNLNSHDSSLHSPSRTLTKESDIPKETAVLDSANEEDNNNDKSVKKRVLDIPICSVKPNKRLKLDDEHAATETKASCKNEELPVKEEKPKAKASNMGRLKREQMMKLIAKTGKQFRCRLCQDSGYVFKRPEPVIQHLVNVHVTKGVLDKNRLVLPCLLDCYVNKMRENNQSYTGERIHYHCIDCQAIICRKSSFLEHTKKHVKEKNSNSMNTDAVGKYQISENNGLL